MMRPALAGAAALLTVMLPDPALAQDALRTFQQREQQLFAAGTRLARANARLCDEVMPASGFLLHDAAAYGEPAAVRKALGLAGDIGIQAIAPGSGAEAAGLKVNDTIVALGGQDIASTWPASDPGWQRGETLRAVIADALATGALELTVSRPGAAPRTVTIAPQPACASRFEVLDRSNDAWADGERVAMGVNWPAFGYDEDAFAASVAHELAHNIRGHVAALATVNRKQRLVRISERDADRLMPWLLWNAGYDPEGAVRWMKAWGARYTWLNRKRTHDAWDERVAAIEAEIAVLRSLIEREGWQRGEAAWNRHFQPEFEPALAGATGG